MEKQSLRTDDCLDDIISNYGDMVYRLSVSQMKNKYDADDVFQEVFFRYIKKDYKFDSEQHRKAWFIRVTINCCKTMYASAWWKRFVPLGDEVIFETKEENDLFAELQKLPMKYRSVIHLFYYEDMSIDDICMALKKKPSAVKMQLLRARKMLKEIINEEDFYV